MEGHLFTNSLAIENTTNNINLHVGSDSAFGVFSYGLGVLITVINIASLVCLVKYRKHIRGAGFSQQLMFLCFTDILSGIALTLVYFGSLFSFIDSLIYYSFCIAGIVIYPISNTLSIGNCCIISVQRYIAMRNITQQTITCNKRRTINMILFNILLSIFTFLSSVAVIVLRYGFQYEDFCDHINKVYQDQYKFLYLIGPIVMCLLFALLINVLTVLSIFQLAKVKREHFSSVEGFESESSSNQFTQIQDVQYATKTFVLIVIVLNITFLPASIFLPFLSNSNLDISATYFEMIIRLPAVKSLLNPFVYFSRMKSFRRAVWNDLKKLFQFD